MIDIPDVVIGLIIGAVLGYVIGVTSVIDLYEKGKDECEADLPRSQQCEMVYVPKGGG